jgi:hypothetical protein
MLKIQEDRFLMLRHIQLCTTGPRIDLTYIGDAAIDLAFSPGAPEAVPQNARQLMKNRL